MRALRLSNNVRFSTCLLPLRLKMLALCTWALFLAMCCSTRVYCTRAPNTPFNDANIACLGEPAPPDFGWPRGRSPDQYTTNDDLCVAFASTYTLGCVCPGPGAYPRCSMENGADPVLFNYRLYGHEVFQTWCTTHCSCIAEDEIEAFRAQAIPQQHAEEEAADDVPPDLTSPTSGSGFAGLGAFPNFAGAVPAGFQALNGTSDANDSPQFCGGACTSIGANCSTSDCTCRVTSSTFVPGADILKYTAACGLSLNIKRDGPFPCPCNSTYVSHGCCLAGNDGLIWEASDLKLGELLEEEL